MPCFGSFQFPVMVQGSDPTKAPPLSSKREKEGGGSLAHFVSAMDSLIEPNYRRFIVPIHQQLYLGHRHTPTQLVIKDND